MNKLGIDFYKRKDVVAIAKALLGKILVTNFGGQLTSGRIVETEAYAGTTDKASHAYAGKRTARNEHMYAQGGTAYIYVCYGIHQLFNIVTNEAGVPDAVLIRSIEPCDGIATMLARTAKQQADFTLTRGPGNLGKALGINKSVSGVLLTGDVIFVLSDDFDLPIEKIACGPRIGVAYAGSDALLPYRFFIKGNRYVSGSNKLNLVV